MVPVIIHIEGLSVFRQTVVRRLIPEIEEYMPIGKTLFIESAVNHLKLGHACPEAFLHHLPVLRRQTAQKVLPAFERRDPSVARADETDKKRPGAVNALCTHVQHLSGRTLFVHSLGIYAKTEVYSLKFHTPGPESSVDVRDYFKLDDIPFDVHILERRAYEDVVSFPMSFHIRSVLFTCFGRLGRPVNTAVLPVPCPCPFPLPEGRRMARCQRAGTCPFLPLPCLLLVPGQFHRGSGHDSRTSA